MFSNTMPTNTTTDTNMAQRNTNEPSQPKYKTGDIIIISGNKKRHIFGDEPSWSSEYNQYLYQVDYGLGCTREGVVLESNILRIAKTTGPDAQLAL